MTNEEMKLVKFERMIKELDKKLDMSIGFKNNVGNFVRSESFLLGNESSNPYVKVLQHLIPDSYMMTSCQSGYISSVDMLLDKAKKCNECGASCADFGRISFHTIFFSLLALAIDHDLYNEKLEIISDAAYLMGFNEEMMEDWVYAVKKFLLAEPIETDQMRTELGKGFFALFE